MAAFTLRPAQPQDAPIIRRLIADLAEYEKEPHQVVCNEADILRDGFGDQPIFECVLAEVDDRPAGFALFFPKWSTWTGQATLYLEDLFVKPEFRGRAIGFGLLKHLAGLALERGWPRMEWEVLDWNTLAIDFYRHIGAYHKRDWLPYRLEGQALADLAAKR